MKQVVLLFVISIFSCAVNANDQIPNCRSWWSGPDKVRHCLISGNEEESVISVSPSEEFTGKKVEQEENEPEYISPPDELPEHDFFLPNIVIQQN